MSAIQGVLLAAGIVWLIRYLARTRVTGLSRILGLVAFLGAMTFVLFPDLTSILAKLFGVGRGVDLVIYISLAGIGFLWLHEASRLKDLESRLTDLARQFALREARSREEATGDTANPDITPLIGSKK